MPFCNPFTQFRFCLAGFAAFCFSSVLAFGDFTATDSSNLSSVASDVSASSADISSILSALTSNSSYSLLWELEAQRTLLNTINAALTSNNSSSLFSKVDEILLQLQPSWSTGYSNLAALLNDWKLDQSSDLSAILAAIQAQGGVGGTNIIEVAPNVYVTNICECPPYDDIWLKRFLTGRADGENIYTPKFRYTGLQTTSAADADQNLQAFLSYTIGSLRDNTRNYNNLTWEQAFNAAIRKTGASDSTMGVNYQYFTYWLAEGIRRLLETNQLVATNVELNRRSITENLALILSELREGSDTNLLASTTNDAQQASAREYEEAEEDLDQSVEDYSYDMPSIPSVEIDRTDVSDSTGLSSIENVEHSAIITLSSRTLLSNSVYFPRMEIEILGNSGLSSFLAKLSVIMRAFITAIFAYLTFILYYRAYRQIRGMLDAAACSLSGCSPAAKSDLNIEFNPL